jgi:putative lipoprotein
LVKCGLFLTLLLAGCLLVPVESPPRTMVYSCSGGLRLTARESGGLLQLLEPGETRTLVQKDSRVGRLYTDSEVEFWIQEGSARLANKGQVTRVCRPDPAAAIWEEARLRGVDFRGAGNEPGWFVELTGDQLVYAGEYGRQHLSFSGVQQLRDDHLAQTVIAAEREGQQLEMLLQAGDCRDSMSGESFDTRVRLKLDGKTYFGCGKRLN